MSGINDLIQEAIKIGSNATYKVAIDGSNEGSIEKMTYIQLGAYLVSNVENIEIVRITLKD